MAFGRGISKHLVGPDDGLATADVHINEIRAGSGLGHYHVHKQADNIYVVLSGTMEAVVDGRRYVIPQSSVVVIPAGTPHAAGNAGEGTARVVEIYAPGGEDFHILKPPGSVIDDATGTPVECEFRWEPDKA
jgi:mannose-6-phosphate isomerase-like protein (cupin superfamily)